MRWTFATRASAISTPLLFPANSPLDPLYSLRTHSTLNTSNPLERFAKNNSSVSYYCTAIPPTLLNFTFLSVFSRSIVCLATTLKALRAGGNVLIATDAAGRVLELAFLLEQCWSREQQFENMTLAIVSNVAQLVLEFARSLLEWSSEKLLAQVPAHNPFDLPHVRLVHTLEQLRALSARGPTVALTSGYDLEVGLARSLFLEWVGSPNNAVILTNRSARGTLCRFLIDNKQVLYMSLYHYEYKQTTKMFELHFEYCLYISSVRFEYINIKYYVPYFLIEDFRTSSTGKEACPAGGRGARGVLPPVAADLFRKAIS